MKNKWAQIDSCFTFKNEKLRISFSTTNPVYGKKWQRVNTVSPTLDTAFLCYLESKYLDANSRFTDFALKMLEIKIEE